MFARLELYPKRAYDISHLNGYCPVSRNHCAFFRSTRNIAFHEKRLRGKPNSLSARRSAILVSTRRRSESKLSTAVFTFIFTPSFSCFTSRFISLFLQRPFLSALQFRIHLFIAPHQHSFTFYYRQWTVLTVFLDSESVLLTGRMSISRPSGNARETRRLSRSKEG
jgi:hypothetical protein